MSLYQLQKLISVFFHLDAPHVQHDQRGFEAGSSLNGFEAVLEGAFTFA